MALEITGFAIGTIALIGTFKDCIDFFGMITAARSINDDANILNTKLDVERMLLLQWADRIGLTEPDHHDQRLNDPDLNRTLVTVLESIKRLLSDGKVLRDRYGLVDYQDVRDRIVLHEKLEITASSTRLQQFMERFSKLSIRGDVEDRNHSVTSRFRWVVRDKEKFSGLMQELSYFVSRLHALAPPHGHFQSAKTMTEEDLAHIRSIPQLKYIVQASIGAQPQVFLMAQQAIRLLNQERILDCLWFRWIDDRKTSIKDRHFRTLDWALEPQEPTTKWDSLAEWLRDKSGLYWLAGKAGSGKSTLMKYVSNHPRATELLKEWSQQSELVTLQFFFYALGRSEQKSQEGVLRSLLFQFLENHRDLIEFVVPTMWKEAMITEDEDLCLSMPSISEMQTSLLHLAGTVSTDKKFWILIDGLDEFEGKHATIATFLARLERLPNVKILTSSRPLAVFASTFCHAPKMYLQDLTQWDIEAYINDTILHHPQISQLSRFEPGIGMKIAVLLINKASGVFLWVILACQSILEGFQEYDTVPELINRLMELPPELGDFFHQIIAGIDSRNRNESAKLLRLVFESQISYAFDPIPTMGLAIVDEQGLRADYMGTSVAGLTNEEMVLRCQMFEGRLRSRCAGLVEIQGDSAINLASPRAPLSAEDAALVNSRVVFMHRSLYEFLCTEGMWESDILRVERDRASFEPHLILASLWTQSIGLQPWGDISFKNTCINNALVHHLYATANKCPPKMSATNLSRLQGLFAGPGLYGPFWDRSRLWLPHEPKCRIAYNDLSIGLALAAELGMVGPVQLALEDPEEIRCTLIPHAVGQLLDCGSFATCPTRLYDLNRELARSKLYRSRSTVFPLLYHATCRPLLDLLREMNMGISKASKEISMSMEVTRFLLETGHDPNEEFCVTNSKDGDITTPWIRWLKFISPNGRGFVSNLHSHVRDSDSEVETVHQRAAFTMLFVQFGATLGAPGTYMYDLVDLSLSMFFRNAAERSGGSSVEWARSDKLWLQVRDTILASRSAASTP